MAGADTIFALSSGAPPAAIAVLRISGPAAFAAVKDLSGELPPPRHASLRHLRDVDGTLLDQALVLPFEMRSNRNFCRVFIFFLHGAS